MTVLHESIDDTNMITAHVWYVLLATIQTILEFRTGNGT